VTNEIQRLKEALFWADKSAVDGGPMKTLHMAELVVAARKQLKELERQQKTGLRQLRDR
jgi:hypothetical protein